MAEQEFRIAERPPTAGHRSQEPQRPLEKGGGGRAAVPWRPVRSRIPSPGRQRPHSAETRLELRRRNLELSKLAVSDPTHRSSQSNAAIRPPKCRAVRTCSLPRRRRRPLLRRGRFKGAHDRHGHEAGDRVLCYLAEHLSANVRTIDTVARIPGDEFAVMCPDVTDVELDQIVERLTACGTRAFPNSNPAPRLSVGAVLASADDTSTSVLRRADHAMCGDNGGTLRPVLTHPAPRPPLVPKHVVMLSTEGLGATRNDTEARRRGHGIKKAPWSTSSLRGPVGRLLASATSC